MSARPPRRRVFRRRTDDSGAALVEFALIAPLLFLLLFGIFEFGFVFGQHLDVRHGARETARLAAVNYNPNSVNEDAAQQAADLIEAGCERMQLADDVAISLEGIKQLGDSEPTIDAGDFVLVEVSAPARQITGFFSPILDNVDLSSDVEIRLEARPTYLSPSGTAEGDCP